MCGSLVGWDSLLTFSEPELVSLEPSGFSQNVSSSPAAFLKSLRTWAAPLPLAKFTTPGRSRLICFGFFNPACAARYSGFAVAVTLVPWTVMSNWSVTSRPLFAMSATEDAASVVASASYTRIFDLSDVRSQM